MADPASAAPEDSVSLEDIRRAARALGEAVRHTPVVSSRTLSERLGGTVALKAENLQRTGSFKLRGALARVMASEDAGRGVITASAGNHGQALAYAARVRGVPCEVFMPRQAAVAKVEATEELGAKVRLTGPSVNEALAEAQAEAERRNLAFVHPFDDPKVIAGQGSVGLELIDEVPDLAAVLVPVGGGGLVSGIAIAIKSQLPDVRIIGVQASQCAPFARSLAAGQPVGVAEALTIADGIAVKQPGQITLPLVERWVDQLLEVSEDEVGEAMMFLLERAKLVVEGAGAVGVAVLLSGKLGLPDSGTTVAILSGGNVDPGLLAQVARRHESQSRRRLVLLARIPDRPGALAALLSLVADGGANLLDVVHVREGFDLHVRESAVQLVLETRGPSHAQRVIGAVREAGYAEPRPLR